LSAIARERFKSELIAPCGANCGICVAYFGYRLDGTKRKKACSGCRSRKSLCTFIKKPCRKLAAGQIEYCFECSDFPCERLKELDNRYREKYKVSMIENLKMIQSKGMKRFLESERKKWKCPVCGGIISVHDRRCYSPTDLGIAQVNLH